MYRIDLVRFAFSIFLSSSLLSNCQC
jgi:hypothetical protein